MASRRQHGEGSLYQRRSDGRWIASVNLGTGPDGKRQRRVFTATTPEAARLKREAFLDRRRDGFTMPKGRPPTVAEWCRHWLMKIAKPQVEATTWERSYRSNVERHVIPYFASVPLPDLGEEDIEAFHAYLRGRNLSASSIGQIHRIMSRALKVAVARGRIARNPCSYVSPPPVPHEEARTPTADETAVILEACGSWPNGARWVLAITTGIRQGEALALRWSDIDLTGSPASVTIRRTAARIRGELTYKPPKSRKSRRTIAIGPATVAALKAHRAKQVAAIGGLVFTDPQGRPVHPRADYGDWHALLDSLGIERYRVHALRHGAATRLLEAGVDVRTVQEIMGHATPGFTQATYQHVTPVLHQAAADAMDRLAGGR